MGIFCSSDAAGQGYAPYSYCGNNPVINIDKNGRFFLIDDLLIGAAIGALFSGTTYSALAGKSWTWKGFGSALEGGAIGGAVSAGFCLLRSASG